MSEIKSLTGNIIVSQPRSEDPYFTKGVILVAKHGPSGSWGLMVNKPAANLTLGTIMQAVGIDSKKIQENMDDIFISKNIYILGETYSDRQAWIEGAIETVHKKLKI